MFFKAKKANVTETTTLYRDSLKKLDEEHKNAVSTLTTTFHQKLKDLLKSKRKNIDDLNTEISRKQQTISEELSDIDKIKEEFEVDGVNLDETSLEPHVN